METEFQHNTILERRRPLAGLATCWAIGILCCRWTPASCAAGLALVALLSAFFSCRLPGARAGNTLLMLAVIACSCLCAQFQFRPQAPDHLVNQLGPDRRKVDLVIDVHRPPEAGTPDESGRWWHFPAVVNGLKRGASWSTASGQVLVFVKLPVDRPPPAYGDRLSVTGMLQGEEHPLSGALQLKLFVRDSEKLKPIASGFGNPLYAACWKLRGWSERALKKGLREEDHSPGVISALLLGSRSELDSDLREAFTATGTLHVFAISGLHIGVLVTLLIGLFKGVGIRKANWFWYLLPILAGFCILTGLRASALRAAVMALVYYGAFAAGRQPDPLSAWAASAWLILLAAPGQLFEAGFQFSFVLVLALLLAAPALYRQFSRRLQRDAFALTQDEPGWKITRREMGLYLAGLAAVSVVAWVAAAPLTAWHFNRFSPVGLVGNLLVVPGAFVLVLCGGLSLLCAPLVPLLSEVFNHAARVLIDLLIGWVGWLESLPGGHQYVRSPPDWLVATLLAGGLVILWLKRRYQVRAALLLLLLSLTWLGGSAIRQRDRLTVDLLDSGRGQSALIQYGPRAMVIDTGPRFFGPELVTELHRRGIDRLDQLVLTHADANHAGGALYLLEYMPVGVLLVSSYEGRSTVYSEALTVAREVGVPLQQVTAPHSGTWHTDALLDILHPPGRFTATRADEASLVIRLAREGAACLFMGGAGTDVETALLDGNLDLGASLLFLGNPSKESAGTPPFIRATGAELVILSGRATRQVPAALSIADQGPIRIELLRNRDGGGVRLKDDSS